MGVFIIESLKWLPRDTSECTQVSPQVSTPPPVHNIYPDPGPAVKFKDSSTGLDCDLNVNERLGIHNSEMINEYCALSPVLRPLLFSIKEWAKPLGLNTPSGGLGISVSFSSYALALMTIAFLQVRQLVPYFLLVLIYADR